MAVKRTRRPRIAVTGPDRGGFILWCFTALAVWRAGGRPVRVRPSRPGVGNDIDGLIVGGGADVDPGLYGAQPNLKRIQREAVATKGRFGLAHTFVALFVFAIRWLFRMRSTTKGVDRERDAMESRLIERALTERQPILGICRGAQLLNVVLGGTLHQDLAGFYDGHEQLRTVFARKSVDLVRGSRIARTVGTTQLCVNALHGQAVARPGHELTVVAREASGVAQAIERSGPTFVVGVQWHPELLPQIREHQSLFQAIVRASARRIAAGRAPTPCCTESASSCGA